MKKLTAVFSLFLALFGTKNSQATHLIGGEIEYTGLAPNIFLATYKVFYDCRSTIPPASIQFNLKSPGCNTGTTFTSEHQTIVSQSLNPYCESAGNHCTSNALINLRMSVYSATFSFTPAQLQCKDWLLSVRNCDRSGFANLPDAIKSCLYVEAYINTAAYSGNNSSPGFVAPSDMFVTVNAPATISNFTEERKNYGPDSLAYSLVPALENYNTPLVYAPGLSYNNPVPTATGLKLNPNTGLLSFIPNVFVPSANPEHNAYAVVIQATAYEKINGVMTKVSTAQRNLPVYMVNNAPNVNPEISKVTANGKAVAPNSIIQVPAGSSLIFKFAPDDANAADSLTALMPGPALSGFSFTSSGGKRPTGTIRWQAPPVASNKIVYFPVMVKDNACPVRGTVTQIYGIKVVAGPSGIQNAATFDPEFTAFPNPFSTAVHFRFSSKDKVQTLVICNILGQEIDRIPLKSTSSETQQITWENAHKFSSGVYLARLEVAGKTTQTLKFTKVQ
ncbi:T9SS type A sorting domain-containing protein [Adhaeribacter sp. BT258]|uniref:T9SS type A sorting domain-containing protein n=1 Tax=Adhaeribacter terrigena TaxID=2793070 RepID=A0ABS1C489_9BACT|nr:T9SS type A sorting domain-containing protein [Adhaeribacter terrigena]MBK0403987.1 T9SS type A sorting domain-containing protein [Adhaeribacter terrigena]